jgi:predicted transcriptional regulator
MSDFNYQEYLRNNPLLKEEVKDQLITESQEVEEAEIPSASLTKINAEVKNVQTMAQAILDFIEQVKEKEAVDFGANANMKIILNKLNTLAKTEEKEPEAVAESEEVTENVLAQKLRDEATHPDSKVGASILNKYAEKVEKADKKDYVKLLKAMESELISKHPNTFSGEDDIPGSFLSEEITEEAPSSKMKVSELKAKIKEDIMSLLQEEEEDEVEVEDEIEDEVEVDVEEPSMDTADAGLSQDEQDIQDSLKLAYDNAVAIGDQKLADQIGNSITFFTRTHVVER